jgi:nitrite reductase (NADH) large subunit
MPKVLDDQGAAVLHRRIIEVGVELHVERRTEGIERNKDGTMTVFTHGEKPFTVDLIIVGTGVRPNVQFVENEAIRRRGGIPVNDRMQSDVEGIYAAGDVAQGPTTFGEPHETHALWPTAVEQGKVAGANMAGRIQRYQGSLNMNVTEMFGLSVASMGRYGDSDQTEAYIRYEPETPRYIKVLRCGDIPVGGVVIGPAEDVVLLGALRPMIRQKKKIRDICTLVDLKCYHQAFLAS